MNLLVTGGAGYIGSHTIIELLEPGHSVVALDNLANGYLEAIKRVEQITGKQVPFVEGDIRDRKILDGVFDRHSFDCVIHFAGLKSVSESVEKPEAYYDCNVGGTQILLEAMERHGCKNLIFSSTAAVYGVPDVLPIPESAPKKECANPYGQTKSDLEDLMEDLYRRDMEGEAEHPWNIVLLRYFNPIGAHPSGLIGESPKDIPNNLMPYITQVAVGKRPYLSVFGNDYDTQDGTGVRDYIHVVDLARGHVKALDAIERKCGLEVYNLGTGTGYSVLDLVKAFESATGVSVPYRIEDRRPGDIAACFSDPSKAESELGWKAEFGIEEMCRDAWNWQQKNPDGYKETT